MGLHLFKGETKVDFMGKRKIALVLSCVIILSGILSLLLKGGPQYGIDFVGGVNIQVKFDKDVSLSSIRKGMKDAGMSDIRIQRFGARDKNSYLLRISRTDINPEKLRNQVKQGISEHMQSGFSIQRLDMVGPKVGQDLKNKALQALFYAVLFISIYISGRFEQKWFTAAIMAGGLAGGLYLLELLHLPLSYLILAALLITLGLCWYLKLNYALGAVVALIHDVLITVGIFSLLNKDFDLTTVAALLTIIGYSLNDTIIVFDRIRENLRSKSKDSLFSLINKSINQTLSRTLLTSGTTLIVVLSLVILGGGVIHNFAIALLIGVLVGTYSSIFIAATLLLGFGPTPEVSREEATATA